MTARSLWLTAGVVVLLGGAALIGFLSIRSSIEWYLGAVLGIASLVLATLAIKEEVNYGPNVGNLRVIASVIVVTVPFTASIYAALFYGIGLLFASGILPH